MARCKHEDFSAWEDADGNVIVDPSMGMITPGLRWVTRCQLCGRIRR